MGSFELETMNKLFLELSQFTTATTEREMNLEDAVDGALFALRNGDKKGAIEVLDLALRKARHGKF